jgi:hypothetical protein
VSYGAFDQDRRRYERPEPSPVGSSRRSSLTAGACCACPARLTPSCLAFVALLLTGVALIQLV